MFSSIASAHDRSQTHPRADASSVASNVEEQYVELHGDSTVTEDENSSDTDDTFQDTTPQAEVSDPIANNSWRLELDAFRTGRKSQASSIFSTRTPLTVLSDDAQSINIEAGGQSFRISRDGSYITNTTGAPPPYPGPPLEDLSEDGDEDDGSSFYASRTSTETVRNETLASTASTGSLDYDLPIRTHVPAESPQNSPESRQAGYSLPRMLRSAIQARWYGTGTGTSTSPSSSRGLDPVNSDHSRSRNDLRRTQSDSSGMPRLLQSQWPTDTEQEDAMSSPFLEAERQMQDIDWGDGQMSLDKQNDSSAELSLYYKRIMRDMDKEHRTRLHERDLELARLRELLNEKDIVYRQQLRERDHLIDGLKEKLSYRDATINELKKNAYNLDNDTQMKLEKARSEIEDLWKNKLKERDSLLIEKSSLSSSLTASAISKSPDEKALSIS